MGGWGGCVCVCVLGINVSVRSCQSQKTRPSLSGRRPPRQQQQERLRSFFRTFLCGDVGSPYLSLQKVTGAGKSHDFFRSFPGAIFRVRFSMPRWGSQTAPRSSCAALRFSGFKAFAQVDRNLEDSFGMLLLGPS